MELLWILILVLAVGVVVGWLSKWSFLTIVLVALLAVGAFYLFGWLLKGVFAVASFGISILGGILGWIIIIVLAVIVVRWITKRV